MIIIKFGMYYHNYFDEYNLNEEINTLQVLQHEFCINTPM